MTRLLTLAALLICVLAPGAAGAGPWPREKGTGFLAAATQVSGTDPAGPYALYSTSYFEYGLGRDWTVGFDVGHGISGEYKAVGFARHPVWRGAKGMIAALELGLGVVADEPTLRPGLSLGKGLEFRGGKTGWITLESYAEHRLVSDRTDLKADFTFGVTHSDRVKSIWQLQSGVSSGDPSFLRLAPSLIWKSGASTHLEIGATAGLVGDDSYGLKLGLWRDF